MRILILPLFFCLCSLVMASSTCLAQSSSSKDASAPTLIAKKKANKRKSKKKRATEKRIYASYRDATSAGYELKNAGDLEASRDAYEASLKFQSTDRQKCDAHRRLVSIYPELEQWDQMFESTEYIVEHAPIPLSLR